MMIKISGLFGHNQRGDTIVEVVIAIAIIATVLVGAFAVSSRSLMAVRDSEEHSEALQLLQGQIELLRSAASQAGFFTTHNLNINSKFCLSTDVGVIDYNISSSSNCTVGLYSFAIGCQPASPCPASSSTTTFDTTATWAALRGGNDQVQLAYKVQVE